MQIGNVIYSMILLLVDYTTLVLIILPPLYYKFLPLYVPHTENCEWRTVETGECAPDCGGGVVHQNYLITQEAAAEGSDCPAFVRENVTEVIQCCRE